MKTSIILSALASLAFSATSVFASDVKIPETKVTTATTVEATEQTAQEQEVVFYAEIENYYEANFEASLDEIVSPVKHIVVYDAQGNTIGLYETSAHQELPIGADLLMTDGDTAYYIVLN